jgi:hypothetical protein
LGKKLKKIKKNGHGSKKNQKKNGHGSKKKIKKIKKMVTGQKKIKKK